MTEQLHFHYSLSCTGEGNGNPLQYSCLENPRDRRAWWAAVTQSWTRLKRLSSSSTSGQESLRRNGVAMIVNKRVQNAVLGCNLKNERMISVCFQGKPFKITLIQVYALEIKTRLRLGRKVMTNLDSILKSRDITLPTMSV